MHHDTYLLTLGLRPLPLSIAHGRLDWSRGEELWLQVSFLSTRYPFIAKTQLHPFQGIR
ncbi:hypothetical protein ACRRTK_001650 [Alexandromys fortis]